VITTSTMSLRPSENITYAHSYCGGTLMGTQGRYMQVTEYTFNYIAAGVV